MGVLVAFVAYGLFVAMYNGGDGGAASTFPTFNAPTVSFQTIPSGCSGFFDCTEYVGKVLTNIVIGVVYAIQLIVEIVRVFVAMILLITTSAFSGVAGTPAWINVILLSVFGGSVVVIIYKSIRKGDTDSA